MIKKWENSYLLGDIERMIQFYLIVNLWMDGVTEFKILFIFGIFSKILICMPIDFYFVFVKLKCFCKYFIADCRHCNIKTEFYIEQRMKIINKTTGNTNNNSPQPTLCRLLLSISINSLADSNNKLKILTFKLLQ